MKGWLTGAEGREVVAGVVQLASQRAQRHKGTQNAGPEPLLWWPR